MAALCLCAKPELNGGGRSSGGGDPQHGDQGRNGRDDRERNDEGKAQETSPWHRKSPFFNSQFSVAKRPKPEFRAILGRQAPTGDMPAVRRTPTSNDTALPMPDRARAPTTA